MIQSMLQHFDRLLIEPPRVYEAAIRLKSRLLSSFLLAMIILFSMVDVVSVLTIPGYIVPWYGYVFLLTAYALNRWSYYPASASLVVFMFPAVIFYSILAKEVNQP